MLEIVLGLKPKKGSASMAYGVGREADVTSDALAPACGTCRLQGRPELDQAIQDAARVFVAMARGRSGGPSGRFSKSWTHLRAAKRKRSMVV